MADERLNSYADIPAMEAEKARIELLVTNTIEFVKKKRDELGTTTIALFEPKNSKDASENINKVKKATDDLTVSAKEYQKLQTQLLQTEAKLILARSDENRKLIEQRTELNATNKAIKENQQSTKIAADSNIAMSKTLTDLRKGYDLLTKAERENAEIGGVLAARIQEVDKQLKATDASTGRFQRNVGNYSSATANLNRNIGILATELPNAGISLRTFAQSLSNNITPFVNSIKEVQSSNKILKAEGKATTSVIKSLGQSLLSASVITGVAVAVGLKLIEYWQKGSKAAQEAEKAVTKYSDALKSAEESERSAAQQQIARISILTSLAKDNAQSTRARTLAVEELQKTYPSTFGALTEQAILEGKLGDAVNRTTQALLDRAAAQAAEKKFAAASEQVYDLTLLQNKAIEDRAKAEARLDKFKSVYKDQAVRYAQLEAEATINASNKTIETTTKNLEIARKEQQQFLKDAQENAAKAGDILFNDRKTNAESTRAKVAGKDPNADNLEKFQDAIYAKADAKSKAAMEKIFANLNDVALEQRVIEEKALADLITSLEKGEIGVEEYNAQKLQITKTTEDNILNYQIKALKEGIDLEWMGVGERTKVEEKITNLLNTELQKRNAAREAAAKADIKEKEDNAKWFDKVNKKSSDDAIEVQKKTERAKQELIKESALLVQEILGAVNDAYQRQIDELTAIGEQIDINKDKQIAAINESTLAEDEKARRIAELEAKAVIEKEKSERKIADLKLKQAKLDKAAAIANTIQATAVAVISALKLPPPFGEILAAAVGATGAVQLARIAATPLPKYKDGTTDHKGGGAILGDGGEHELVIEPNKKPYWSADTDTIYNLPKHTQVIPQSKLSTAIGQPSNKDIVNAVLGMTDNLGSGLSRIDRSIRKKETLRLQGKSRRWETYYYENTKK